MPGINGHCLQTHAYSVIKLSEELLVEGKKVYLEPPTLPVWDETAGIEICGVSTRPTCLHRSPGVTQMCQRVGGGVAR